jgi:prefoldin subunit 5
MIEDNYGMLQEQKAAYANAVTSLDRNPTVEENIDTKIERLQAEIERLKRSKMDLAPLLKMRIRDIRQAMDY